MLEARDHIPLYVPKKLSTPAKMIDQKSAWNGLEKIIEDILSRYNIGRKSCIEFGVEFGFSAVVFSNYFQNVTGVDTFEGDEHTFLKGDHFEQTKERLAPFSNIQLFRSDYKDWIIQDKRHYDFAHVDIVHNYKETYECGLWAANHSDCTVFHDTESFPAVRLAVVDIAKATGKKLLNYQHCNGLGILVRR